MSCSQTIIIDNKGSVVDNTKFHCHLPDVITFPIDQKYCITLKSLHVSHSLCNILRDEHYFKVITGAMTKPKYVKFKSNFFCNSIDRLVSALNEVNTRFNEAITFLLTYEDKVGIYIGARDHKVILSDSLALLLGFDKKSFDSDPEIEEMAASNNLGNDITNANIVENIQTENKMSANIAKNLSNLFHKFHKMYLLAPEIVDLSIVGQKRMPLLRMFSPDLYLLEKYGVIEMDFLDEHYYTMFPTSINDLVFQFLDCNFEVVTIDEENKLDRGRFSAQIDRRPILFNL